MAKTLWLYCVIICIFWWNDTVEMISVFEQMHLISMAEDKNVCDL